MPTDTLAVQQLAHAAQPCLIMLAASAAPSSDLPPPTAPVHGLLLTWFPLQMQMQMCLRCTEREINSSVKHLSARVSYRSWEQSLPPKNWF